MSNCLLTRSIVVVWFLLLLLGWNATIAKDDDDKDEKQPLLLASIKDDSDHCITSADCAFNGECVKNAFAHINLHTHKGANNTTATATKVDPEAPGFCACFDGWKGTTCEVLDLLPVDSQKVGLVLPNRESSTWGGSIVYHDGLYHMFASEILYNCGLYSWTTNSQVRFWKCCHNWIRGSLKVQ